MGREEQPVFVAGGLTSIVSPQIRWVDQKAFAFCDGWWQALVDMRRDNVAVGSVVPQREGGATHERAPAR